MADHSVPPNGPGFNPSQGAPPWEKPLSTQEMRLKCDRWTLAGDAGLLNFLQQFSQKVISKTHEMEQLLNSLEQDTKVTGTKVSNVMNDFHMLSNTQFVESRVYDEDVVDDRRKTNKKPEETKTKEEREAELIAKVTTALNLGLTTLDLAFEKVELQEDSDSEEEDSIMKGGTILEARDPYLQRPLPLLIGTSAFFSDDYVGLQDVPSEEEEVSPEKEDIASDISSETESEPELIAVNRPKPKDLSDSESRGSDLFPSDREDGEYLSRSSSFSTGSEVDKVVNVDQMDRGQVEPPADSIGPGLLADELDNRLRRYTDKPLKNRESRLKSDTASVHSRSSRKSSSSNRTSKKANPAVKKAPSDEDLFGHAAEDVNEEDEILFGRKSGLFSSGGKLFDSEESGLFDEIKPQAKEPEEKLIKPQEKGKTKSGRKIPSGAVPVLTDGDLFSTPKSRKSVDVQPDSEEVPKVSKDEPKPVKKSQNRGGGLFDDSEDDDDLFGFSSQRPASSKPTVSPAKRTPAPPKVTSAKTSGPKTDLFASDDEDENSDLFGVANTTSKLKNNTKKRPAGAVPIFGDLSKAISSNLKPMKDDDSDNSSDSGPGSSGGTSSRSRSSFAATATPATTTATPKQTPQSIKQSRSNSVSSNSLFAEDPETDDLFTTVTNKPDSKVTMKETKKSFLFDDNSDDEGNALFSSQPSAMSKPKSSTSSAPSRTVSDLFDDLDDENSLFAAVAKPSSSSQKPVSGLSLLEEKTNEVRPPEVKVKPEVKPKTTSVPEKKVSLFDDDDGDELFSSGPSRKSTQSPGSMSRKSSVPSPSSATPSVKEAGQDEVDTGRKKGDEEVTKTRATSLFDDEDLLFGGPPSESPEVDLFTAKQTEPEKPVPKPKASPVGGVALFGGANLFGQAKNNKASPIIAEITEAIQSKKSPSPTIPVVEEPTRRRAPPLKDSKEISVSFDDPVDTSNTLLSAAKDRAKGQLKRRPPSRKGRQAASRHSGVDFLNEVPEPTPSPEVRTTSVPPEEKQSSKLTRDFPDSKNLGKSDSFLTVSKDVDLQSPSTEEEDLFSVGEPKKDTRLFMDSSNSTVEVKSSLQSDTDRPKKGGRKTTNIFGSDDDEDIFSSPPSKKEALEDAGTSIQKNGNVTVKVNDLFDDAGDDDIFGSLPKKKLENTTSVKKNRSIFDDDGDDDDIFAMPANSKPSQSSQTKETTKRKTVKNSSSVEAFSDPLLALQNDDTLK